MSVVKFRLPFNFTSGRADTVLQDGSDDRAQRVEALMRTTVGEREELPAYGVPDMVFRTNGPDEVPVREAIEKWEPGVAFAVKADGSDLPTMIGRIRVTMEQAAGGSPQ